MRRRSDWRRLTCDVESRLKTERVDVRKPLPNLLCGEVPEIQIHIDSRNCAVIYRPRHDVAGRQLIDETPAAIIDESCSFAAQRLGYEKWRIAAKTEGCGMELNEFHIAQNGPGPISQ